MSKSSKKAAEAPAKVDQAEADRVAAENAAAEAAAAEAAAKEAAEKEAAEKAAAEAAAAEAAAEDAAEKEAAEKAAADSQQALFGSDILPSIIELTPDVSVQLGDVVRHAFEASGLSVEEFNAQHPSHREEQLQASIAAMRQDAEQASDEATAADLEELGLSADADGNVEIEMLTGLSGPTICLANGDAYLCAADEAVRMVRAGAAKPRG